MKRYRNFTDQDINKHLYCSICQEVFYKPCRATCGHTFCKPCIAIWANIKQNCPLCRKKIKKQHFEKDLLPSKIIDELNVQCPNDGCKWINKNELLQNHLRTCKVENSCSKDDLLEKQSQKCEIVDKQHSDHQLENQENQNQQDLPQNPSQPVLQPVENCQENILTQQTQNYPIYNNLQYYPVFDYQQVIMLPIFPLQYFQSYQPYVQNMNYDPNQQLQQSQNVPNQIPGNPENVIQYQTENQDFQQPNNLQTNVEI